MSVVIQLCDHVKVGRHVKIFSNICNALILPSQPYVPWRVTRPKATVEVGSDHSLTGITIGICVCGSLALIVFIPLSGLSLRNIKRTQ